ncbi:AAA-like domain-containing protein [Spirulina sp. 06S082]|uniref:AAA-like domain-containing protein n=1 Tax=Spirulina sp. 06S082 TaxID=3110248 RepID=UPI002B20FDAA|nr:AAA-like domain-containing protein [Spirulina sp. 06S082]MEA5470302.1 AAA-like domain-containing protein [Spirulina sp. 06S082]
MKNIEEVLKFVESSVYSQTEEHLNDLQRIILRESWQRTKKTYDSIAEEYGYSANYIKQGVAPKLWRLLSHALGEKVTKTNLHSVLERNMTADKQTLATINAPSTTSAIAQLIDSDLHFDLELPLESVPLDSPFYIERVPDEQRCYQEITRDGAFIRIKAPRQMGKTSLMMRILAQANQKGYKTGLLHFQQAEASVLNDINRLLRWLCANLSLQLGLKPNLDEFWDEDIGSKMSCTLYLQYIFSQVDSPIVVAFDEVNEIIENLEIAREFLSLLRFWHEKTKADSLWRKLRLVMVHSTEIYIPLDINQSPLNVGVRVELQPFTIEQILELVKRYGLALDTKQIEQLMRLLAGHPYLSRLSLYHLARGEVTFQELLETASTDTGIYSDRLHRCLWYFQQNPALLAAFKQVVKSHLPIALEQVDAFKLHSMGLVHLDGNQVTVSCDLYRDYFRERIGDK